MNSIGIFLWSIVFILLWMVVIIYYGKSIAGYIIQKRLYKLSYMMYKNLKRDFKHTSVTYDKIMEHIQSVENIEFDEKQKIAIFKNEKEEFHLLMFAILDIRNDQLLLPKNRKEFKIYFDFYMNQLLLRGIEKGVRIY